MSKKFIEQKITSTLKDNYMPYAMSVIISRAIPEIDGFKPSHRKLLYTMYKMGLLSGSRTKSANVVGQTMKLNPHGDMAIYETLVRLTKGNDALLHPYIDSKGNFGKQYSKDMAYAAPRYTEVKLAKICNELFDEIDRDTVDFTDNYDGTMKEPVLLPTKFPNILVNPNQGIAVGMASNFCSFNLEEVCEATIAFLNHEDIDIKKYLKAPDFSTGGELIFSSEEIDSIYRTGRGSFRVRAKHRYDKKNNCIEVFEIPYSTTIEAIIEKIIDLIKQGKIKEINDVRDETDLNGLKLTIDLKKGVDNELIMSRLMKLTPLCDYYSCNFNILINGVPKVLSVAEILKEWTIFRISCIKRQLTFDIAKKSDKLHLLLGLRKILLNIDKAIRIIRETEQEALVIPNLMSGFSIDELQAEFIAEIKLRNLNKEYILKRTDEIAELEREIEELKTTLSEEAKIKKLIISQLRDIIKKYKQPRKTEIIHEDTVEEIPMEQFIEDYSLKIFLTEHNYLKKISFVSLRTSGEQRLKDDDAIISELDTTNKADLLLFSNKQNVFKLRIYETPDSKASTLGEYLPNILELEEGEKIIDIISTTDYSGFVLFAFENGKMAKVAMRSFATKTNRKKLANAYSGLSKAVSIHYLAEDAELAAFSTINKVLVFNTAQVALKTTRDSQGVQVMSQKRNSRLAKLKKLTQLNFADINYYRTKNIPAVGCFIKNTDSEEKQLNIFDIDK